MLQRNKLLVVAIFLSWLPSSFVSAQEAGEVCSPTSSSIEVRANKEATDLIACAGGVWHSLIYPTASAPTGAIIAFNASSCPSGWSYVSALAGRTIIGSGQGNGLTNRNLYDWGGEESHSMSVNELVPHQVTMNFGASQKGGSGNGYAYSDNAGGSSVRATYVKTSNTVGNGQPFNVMMPYFTLLYCQKN